MASYTIDTCYIFRFMFVPHQQRNDFKMWLFSSIVLCEITISNRIVCDRYSDLSRDYKQTVKHQCYLNVKSVLITFGGFINIMLCHYLDATQFLILNLVYHCKKFRVDWFPAPSNNFSKQRASRECLF